MTEEDIFSCLCWYDHRNPGFMDVWWDMLDDAPEPRTNCHCDNCFMGVMISH